MRMHVLVPSDTHTHTPMACEETTPTTTTTTTTRTTTTAAVAAATTTTTTAPTPTNQQSNHHDAHHHMFTLHVLGHAGSHARTTQLGSGGGRGVDA